MSGNDLTYPGGKLRLYVEAPLHADSRVVPDEAQAHYLLHVMRGRAGDRLSLFNGRDGEWSAHIAQVSKRTCTLACDAQIAPQTDVPDLWLCFAPVKKTPADYLVQKSTELGVRRLQPVFTRRTIVTRINEERLRANAIEAAEQSGRLTVPDMPAPLSLDRVLADWPTDRRLIFCDEGGDAMPIAKALANVRFPLVIGCGASSSLPKPMPPLAILTGPEGGFDSHERETLRALRFVTPVSLGPRILRADTAALAALAIFQAIAGDLA